MTARRAERTASPARATETFLAAGGRVPRVSRGKQGGWHKIIKRARWTQVLKLQARLINSYT